MSKRAVLCLLAGLALALTAGVVATAKPAGERSRELADQLASARLSTAKYATDLGQAKADGYRIITRMIPDMGWHFMNPDVRTSTSAARRAASRPASRSRSGTRTS
jgi:hypothetical protein